MGIWRCCGVSNADILQQPPQNGKASEKDGASPLMYRKCLVSAAAGRPHVLSFKPSLRNGLHFCLTTRSSWPRHGSLIQTTSVHQVQQAQKIAKMSKPTVLLIGGLTHCNKEWLDLGKKYNLKEFRTGTRDQFLSNCKNGAYNDVIALYRSNNSVSETGPFDKELLTVLPKSLKYICHNGAGYDNIGVDAFTKSGISISSTPIAVDDSTADTGIFLMLGALRHASIPLDAIRAGKWRGDTPIGHDPKGKILGILGMGGIGRVSPPFHLFVTHHS